MAKAKRNVKHQKEVMFADRKFRFKMYAIVRRILAIIGIIILVGLYITTFVIGISGGEHMHDWLIASIAATVAVPCMIWVIQFIYKRLNADMDEVNRRN